MKSVCALIFGLNAMSRKRKILLAFVIVLAFNSIGYSQQCNLTQTYMRTLILSEVSTRAQLYDAVKNDTINDHILLMTSYGLIIGGPKIFHITFDSLNKATVKLTKKDSSILIRQINFSDSSRNRLFDKTQPGGFYSGFCHDHNYHLTQILIISNPKNKKWVEVTTFDIEIKDLLDRIEGFEYIKRVIQAINTIDPERSAKTKILSYKK
jgi:hypothetical protein